MRNVALAVLGAALLPTVCFVHGVPPDAAGHGDGVTTSAQPSASGLTAMKSFKFDQGLNVSLFASEPLLANPVAFAPDDRGRWFIAESFRQ